MGTSQKKKKPRVWQRAGSLCSYEAQNLMSMNNEYYSTCWWLSRMPVIRSAKALFSWENACRLSEVTESPLLRARNCFRSSTKLLPLVLIIIWWAKVIFSDVPLHLKPHLQPLKTNVHQRFSVLAVWIRWGIKPLQLNRFEAAKIKPWKSPPDTEFH